MKSYNYPRYVLLLPTVHQLSFLRVHLHSLRGCVGVQSLIYAYWSFSFYAFFPTLKWKIFVSVSDCQWKRSEVENVLLLLDARRRTWKLNQGSRKRSEEFPVAWLKLPSAYHGDESLISKKFGSCDNKKILEVLWLSHWFSSGDIRKGELDVMQ